MNIEKNKLDGMKYAEGKGKKETDTRLLVCKTTNCFFELPGAQTIINPRTEQATWSGLYNLI